MYLEINAEQKSANSCLTVELNFKNEGFDWKTDFLARNGRFRSETDQV